MENRIAEEFTAFCLKNKIKKTSQRYAVFATLYCNKTHPTVDSIFNEVKKSSPMITLESVYRILNDFENVGLIEKLDKENIIRYDCNIENHSHFICNKCNKIIDIPTPTLPEQTELIGAKPISITIKGICKDCA